MDDDLLLEELLSGTDIVGAEAVATGARKIERLIIGLPATSVGAGATASINVPVTRPFRPRRLILSAASQALTVNSINIANENQFINNEPVSGEVFAPDAVGITLKGSTAQPGVGIDINYTNSTAGALTPAGCIVGEAALPG